MLTAQLIIQLKHAMKTYILKPVVTEERFKQMSLSKSTHKKQDEKETRSSFR